MACTAPRHCKVFFSVAHAEISCRMPAKLVFTASLCKKETKSDHLAFLAVQAVAGIIVSKAVVRQPAVNVSAKRRAIRLALRHIGETAPPVWQALAQTGFPHLWMLAAQVAA